MLKRVRELSGERAQKWSRAGDAVLLGVAASLAAYVDGVFHAREAIALFAPAVVLWAIVSRGLHQYEVNNGRGLVGDIALTLVMLVGVIAPLSVCSVAFSQYVPATSMWRFAAVLIPCALALRVHLVGLPLWRSRPFMDVLVVGVGSLGRLTGVEIRDGESQRRLIGHLRFADEPQNARVHESILGTVADLEQTLRDRVVDEVYFASTAPQHSQDVQDGIRICEKFGVPFALPACPYRLTRARPADAKTIKDGYNHFTTVRVTPIQQAMKRTFDIVVSGTALILLSPLLLVVALIVKVTSPGPVIFKQERVGLLGRKFHMLKFRSMVQNAEALKESLMAQNEQSGPVFKIKRDPRITAIGRFIRKYSIDELPQLLNVLRGDMSIVGPRPPLPSEVAKYEGWERRRLSVRPGLTCVWQVSGRSEISFKEWMLLDMRYIDHFSFVSDLALILKTVPVVLLGRGAS